VLRDRADRPAIDGDLKPSASLGWRAVAGMLDRERLVTGSRR
jgi:hypothetical protein